MESLVLLRHADALDTAPSGEDFDRPLSDKGHKQAARMGKTLLRHALVPDRVVSSPAPRALVTAQTACREMAPPELNIRVDLQIYSACGLDLALLLEQHIGAKRLMVVGHMPAIRELVVLLADPPGDFSFGKGHAVHLRPTPPLRFEAGTWRFIDHFEP